MITFEEALSKAKELKSNIDYCVEYNNAYLFGARSEEYDIGAEACIILKDGGKAIDAVTFFDDYNPEEIREFDL